MVACMINQNDIVESGFDAKMNNISVLRVYMNPIRHRNTTYKVFLSV